MGRGGGPGRGQRPKPIAKHVADGTYRPDRHGPVEESPELTSGTLGVRWRMPSGLTVRMKTAWRTIVSDLEASALLDKADAGVIEAAAVAWGRAGEARALVNKHGMLVTGQRQGSLVANPAVRMEKEAWTQFRQLADQMSLTMSARARLGLALARGRRADAGPAGAQTPVGIGESPRARLRAVNDGE